MAAADPQILDGVVRGRPAAGKQDDPATGLQQKLVDPVLALVGEAKVLHVCLDGALHLIPIEELQQGRTFRFEDSLLRLTAEPGRREPRASMLVVGDLDHAPTDWDRIATKEPHELRPKFTAKFPQGNFQSLTGKQATKQHLEAKIGCRYVHLATHGYFTAAGGQVTAAETGDWEQSMRELAPMTLCGIVLSAGVQVTADWPAWT